MKAWHEVKRAPAVGFGRPPEGQKALRNGVWYYTQPRTGKLFAYGLGDFVDVIEPGSDSGGGGTDPGTTEGRGGTNTNPGGSGQAGGGTREAPPPGGGGGAPQPTPTPTPTPTAPSSSSKTNWTPWILGGAGVVAVGLIGFALFTKPKSKDIRNEAKKHHQQARMLHAAAAHRAREEASERGKRSRHRAR